MDVPERITYTARVTSSGGRAGHAISDAGSLDVQLASPAHAGEGPGATPEELFAAAWSACFNSSVLEAAREAGVDCSGATVTVSLGLGPHQDSAAVTARIEVSVPGLDLPTVQDLADRAHQLCAYSKATRGNVPAEVRAVER
ncbi:MAG: Ohr family peroxiredoxin [Actinomycetales bacterium]|nr:Ohr family peroxiredoxin [Actinomycetales bacterium]